MLFRVLKILIMTNSVYFEISKLINAVIIETLLANKQIIKGTKQADTFVDDLFVFLKKHAKNNSTLRAQVYNYCGYIIPLMEEEYTLKQMRMYLNVHQDLLQDPFIIVAATLSRMSFPLKFNTKKVAGQKIKVPAIISKKQELLYVVGDLIEAARGVSSKMSVSLSEALALQIVDNLTKVGVASERVAFYKELEESRGNIRKR